ncbi:hypothetical protein B296_00048818 [Ensete ventricosum]|uniref:Uncharacterized protein n=1 Tax=Ensete ventricosum TaxID=4639 RepID=A0A426XFG3_ENSVE|nr:hypothetical protein B296_00048818 [Ensete ventricosum]
MSITSNTLFIFFVRDSTGEPRKSSASKVFFSLLFSLFFSIFFLSPSIDRQRLISTVPPESRWFAYRSAGGPVHTARYGALPLDGVVERDDLPGKSTITEQKQHEIQQSDKSNLSGRIHGAQPDDGWELLKGGSIVQL